MSEDPFEKLKRKLEQKKKAGQKAGGPARKPGQEAPAQRQPPPAKKASSWLDGMGGGSASKPPPVPRSDSGQAGGSPRIIRNPWAKEDLERMRESKETIGEGTPDGFESHRYDSELDPKKGLDKKKIKKEPVQRPKGFRSDRADRS
jgi:hypothetical protein